MGRLDRQLARWADAGLVTAEQAGRIRDYERTTGAGRWSRIVLHGFLILGACVVSIGVISLVSANWAWIPSEVKLTTAFVGLAGLGGGAWYAHDRGRAVLFDVLAALYVFWTLATIGLISQVFHLDGRLYEALFFWLAVCLPLAALGKRMFLPALWVTALSIAYFIWTGDDESWWHMTFTDSSTITVAACVTAPVWIALGAALAAHVRVLERFAATLAFWLPIAALVNATLADLYWADGKSIAGAALHPALALLVPALVAVASRRDMGRSARLFLALLLVVSVLAYFPALLGRNEREGSELLGAAWFLAIALLLALHAAASRRGRWFHAMTVVIGLRFLIVHFQVFESLATTGIGLMFSGLIIITVAVGWFKSRHLLEAWGRRLAS